MAAKRQLLTKKRNKYYYFDDQTCRLGHINPFLPPQYPLNHLRLHYHPAG